MQPISNSAEASVQPDPQQSPPGADAAADQPISNSAEASVQSNPQQSPADSGEREREPFPFGERPATLTPQEIEQVLKKVKALEQDVSDMRQTVHDVKAAAKQAEKDAKREKWTVIVAHGLMLVVAHFLL